MNTNTPLRFEALKNHTLVKFERDIKDHIQKMT